MYYGSPLVRVLVLFGILHVGFVQEASAQDPPEARATLRVGPVTIDGDLSEAAWAEATPVSGLIQREPNEGEPASEATEVRFVVDDAALYVAARMYDSEPDRIRSQLTRRDGGGVSDFFQLNLDANHDHLTVYLLRVLPSGSVTDMFADGPQSIDPTWDPVWDVATQIDEQGWTAEMRIPVSQLRFDPDDDTWGLQLVRGVTRAQEFSFFAHIPRTEAAGADRYGHLSGMAPLQATRRAEVMPYALAKAEDLNFAQGDPFHDPIDPSARFGLDAKLGLTSELTLDATINPDFGQVEQDPAEVNLTAFETFFSERRPFFVEGADAFRFGETGQGLNTFQGTNLFYSRRIGRRPTAFGVPPTADFLDLPEQSTIVGAAKVSGRVGGWRVGLMEAVTDREEARFLDDAGSPGAAVVAPLTNYVALRARRESADGNRAVGFLASSVDRRLDDGPLADLLHRHARSAGIDFTLSWNRRNWLVNGFAAGSRVEGSPGALLRTQLSSARWFQRPDAGHVELDPDRTALSGYAAALGLGKVGGGRWLGSVVGSLQSPGWEINDLGFDTRTDERSVSGLLTFRETRPALWFRTLQVDLTGSATWNYDGDRIGNQIALGTMMQLSNYWSFSARVFRTPRALSDRVTRGGPLAMVPSNWTAFVYIGTDPRRSWQASTQILTRSDELGGHARFFNGALSWQASPSVSLTLQPSVQFEVEPLQPVAVIQDPAFTPTFGRRYLFAELDRTTTSLTTRLDWTFTPKLSFQLFAQPFVASGSFSDYKELARARELVYRRYGGDAGSIAFLPDGGVRLDPDGPAAGPLYREIRPDFTARSLRGSAVLRWEYRPGSTLFLVWQQQRLDTLRSAGSGLGEDLDALFSTDSQNVVVLKATFWLGR